MEVSTIGFTQRTAASFFGALRGAGIGRLLDAVKKWEWSWETFERDFLALMADRKVEEKLSPELFAVPTVLLCSEAEPTDCHRRLVLDYLNGKWGNLQAIHL